MSVNDGPALLRQVTQLGDLILFDTTNPFIEQPPQFGCLAFLASWFVPEAPVAMFITYNVFTANGQRVREVHTVYASPLLQGLPSIPGDSGEPDTVAVAVGKWAFIEGYLHYHSADRTRRGDRWARQVGGVLPERVQSASEEATIRNGERALERLNEQDWPTWRDIIPSQEA